MSPTKWISEDILIICQIIASFLIVTVTLINLSLTDRNKVLWSTLLGAGFSYLVPILNRNVSLVILMMSRFTVFLPSNMSTELFPQNVVSKFTTKVSEVLELQGNWDVGLVEILFPGKVHNICGSRFGYTLHR